jgi:hypothetical protein
MSRVVINVNDTSSVVFVVDSGAPDDIDLRAKKRPRAEA